MKRIKKLASLLLAMIMVFTMSATVFASETVDPADPGTGGGDNSETTEKVVVEHTYDIFQIFTGTFTTDANNAPVLSDVEKGQNASGKVETIEGTDKVTESVLTAIAAMSEMSENARAAALAEYADMTSAPYETVQATGTEAIKLQNVPSGYYLIRDQAGTQTGENSSETLYIVAVIDNEINITPKVGTPEVTKKIVEGESKVDDNDGAIGDVVNYEIVGTMPANIDLYNTYFYRFTDTLSGGLTYNEDLKVTVNNVDVTNYFWSNTKAENFELPEAGEETTIIVSIEDIKALSLLTNPVVGDITTKTEVVITYTATINDEAVIGNPGNPNKVKLEYSNNPNNSGTGEPPKENPDEPEPKTPIGETPEDQVITYVTELEIAKVDGSGKPLAGVEFTLTGENLKRVKIVSGSEFVEDENGTYYLLKDGTYTTEAPIFEDTDEVKANVNLYADPDKKYIKKDVEKAVYEDAKDGAVLATTGADGKLTFAGLCEGDYVLKETKPLPGYNTIADININIAYKDGKFTLTYKTIDANGNELTGTATSTDSFVLDDLDNTFSTTIQNNTGSLLPSTGGIGTTIFYVVGGILVIGAGILLVTKRRMRAQ